MLHLFTPPTFGNYTLTYQCKNKQATLTWVSQRVITYQDGLPSQKLSLSIDWFQRRATMLFEIGDDIKITVCD